MENVTQDALELVKTIYGSLAPDDEWVIVNIFKSPDRLIHNPIFPSTILFSSLIPDSFGYIHDRTVSWLEELGVIIGKDSNLWFIKITGDGSGTTDTSTSIEELARKKGFLHKNQHLWIKKNLSIGVGVGGLYSILVSKKGLLEFMSQHDQEEKNIFNFYKNKDFTYENGELHIKMRDHTSCTLDFSKAPILRPIFESFFNLHLNTNRKLFSRDELLEEYERISKQKIGWRLFIQRKSHIGKMINPKPCLKNRIIWEIDKKEDKYKFEILPLSDS